MSDVLSARGMGGKAVINEDRNISKKWYIIS